MAETSQTWWRGAWVRAVARTVKSWADSVLAEQPEPAPATARVAASDSTPAGSKDAAGATVAPAATGTSVEALEARWLRDVQARQRGSAADWVSRVRKGAPGLAEELEREGLISPVFPGAKARPAVSAQPGTLPFARTAVKELRPAMRPAHRSDGEGGGQDVRTEAPLPREASSARAPEPPPVATASSSTARTARPEPEAMPPVRHDTWGLGPEMFAAFPPPSAPARGPARAAPHAARPQRESTSTPDEAPPVRRSPWDDLPAFADESSPREPPRGLRVVPLLPEEERTLTELMDTLPAGSAPRPRPSIPSVSTNEVREPPRNRVAFTVDDDSWAGAQSHLPWDARERAASTPALVSVAPLESPSLESEARASEVAPESSSELELAHPWPELPPATPEERTEVATELRQWERLRRLDREQRGE